MAPKTAVVPVAGRGTRLRPLTYAVPKELLPLGGRPVLEWVVEELRAAGLSRIVLVTSAEKPAIDARIAARQFQGQAGDVTVVVNGMLNVVSIAIARLPEHLPVLDTDVADAINRALSAGKPLIDATVGTVVDTVDTSVITFPAICVYARGNMQLADRVKVKKPDGTFAPVVNAGTVELNVGGNRAEKLFSRFQTNDFEHFFTLFG